ncbi:hypothetical protein CLF_112490 [Clonorchis sinensis]|uniref:Uncharacterized protein n=1 Tax=Clonorchis sinensis TaxID=79923 RepID=H2KVJ5_CLOSI|nr:hypothetical protein CLF_112490 [Clonorchis sinensis]
MKYDDKPPLLELNETLRLLLSDCCNPAVRIDESVHPASVLQATSARYLAPASSGISKSLFKPRLPVYLTAFNVRTPNQAKQQAALALTLDTLGIDVYRVSEARNQDTGIMIGLDPPSLSTLFWLRTSGDPEAAAAGCALLGIALSHRIERFLSDWMPSRTVRKWG